MSLSSEIKSFIIEKFWLPVADESVFYNPFNTAVYSVVFALGAAYIGKPLLQRLSVPLDRKFFLSISPYIFLGGAARSLKDVGIIDTVLLETPLIYFLMFAGVVAALYGSLKLGELTEKPYHLYFGSAGLLALAANLSLYSFTGLSALAEVLLLLLATGVGTYVAVSVLKPELASYGFVVPVVAHWFDASTSYVALMNGAAEKHVLARFFTDLFGPSGIFFVKLLLVVPATYYIFTELEGDEKRYYLFLIALLGIALGTRNLISTVS